MSCGGTTVPYVIQPPANKDCDGKGINLFGARVEILGPESQDYAIVGDYSFEQLWGSGNKGVVQVPIPADGTYLIQHRTGEFGVVVANDPSGKAVQVKVNWSDPSPPTKVYVKESVPATPAQGSICLS